MFSNLLAFALDSSIKTFFNQLTESIGFLGYLAIAVGVEALFILLFVIKSAFSYEARVKSRLDKANEWLFRNKKLTTDNIRELNRIVKRGPKRFSYYWQQFILNREGGPAAYMTEENIIEKPLKTSSWANNVRILTILTCVWSVITLLMGFASQISQTLSFQTIALALVFPVVVLVIGVVAIIVIRGMRALNLDDLYHLYNIFARFVTNASETLPPYIDFNLLFTPREIEKGNAQIRQYYKEMARKAREEFEQAKQAEEHKLDYNFRGVGVDGALLLERAMKESETYINTRSSTLSKIAQIEAQIEALTRTHEDVIMDLQRKMQASKENIEKLIEQQATTTNRFEVGRLREQQDKEVKKLEGFQADYDKEEYKFGKQKGKLDKEIEEHSKILVESLDRAEKGMTAEYDSFYKKVMQSAYSVADNKVQEQVETLKESKNRTEEELINVQTQNKRLLDENETLRAKIEELTKAQEEEEEQPKGQYDEQGNFVYEDGSYHDTHGYFHDVDGKIYDMNGVLVAEEQKDGPLSKEELFSEQIDNFGGYVDTETNELQKELPAEPQTEISQEDMNKIEEKMEENALAEQEKQEQEVEEAQEPQETLEEPQEVTQEVVSEETTPEEIKIEEQVEVEEPVVSEVPPQEETAQEEKVEEKSEEPQITEPEKAEPEKFEPLEEQPSEEAEETQVVPEETKAEEPAQVVPEEVTPEQPQEEVKPEEPQQTEEQPKETKPKAKEKPAKKKVEPKDPNAPKPPRRPRRKPRKRVKKKEAPVFVNDSAQIPEPSEAPVFAQEPKEPKPTAKKPASKAQAKKATTEKPKAAKSSQKKSK